MKTKGTWVITDAGRESHRRFSDPESFYREATRLYRAWKASQPETEDAHDPIEEAEAENHVGDREVARMLRKPKKKHGRT